MVTLEPGSATPSIVVNVAFCLGSPVPMFLAITDVMVVVSSLSAVPLPSASTFTTTGILGDSSLFSALAVTNTRESFGRALLSFDTLIVKFPLSSIVIFDGSTGISFLSSP